MGIVIISGDKRQRNGNRACVSESKKIKIYFGDKRDPFVPEKYKDNEALQAFSVIQKKLSAKSLTFLDQTHSDDGQVCDASSSDTVTFAGEGDFLITNRPGTAIGVLTADCLPIVLHDEKNRACGVVHSGWRGSVAGIVVKTVTAMRKNFSTNSRDIKAYFGPAAGRCCYEVGKNFYKNVSNKHLNEVITIKNDRFFFDNFRLNELQLIESGVIEKNLIGRYNVCTICSDLYHSYRRDRGMSKRQATVAVVG